MHAACMHAYIHIHKQAYLLSLSLSFSMHTRIHIHVYMYLSIPRYICIYTYTCMYLEKGTGTSFCILLCFCGLLLRNLTRITLIWVPYVWAFLLGSWPRDGTCRSHDRLEPRLPRRRRGMLGRRRQSAGLPLKGPLKG